MHTKFENEKLTHQIIGCAMQVHNTLGNGFQEVIYQRALEIEFRLNKIPYSREVEMMVNYKGYEIGTRRVDFLIDGHLIVELKALITLEDVHLAQARNYLEAFDLPSGLLLNFGAQRLEFKRLFNQQKKMSEPE